MKFPKWRGLHTNSIAQSTTRFLLIYDVTMIFYRLIEIGRFEDPKLYENYHSGQVGHTQHIALIILGSYFYIECLAIEE